MGQVLFSLLLGIAGVAQSADPVCIRNYKSAGASACDNFPNAYTHVYALDSRLTPACARIYSPLYCEQAAKDFAEIAALDGTQVCVMNFNQPPVANLCDTQPQFYIYVDRNAP